MSHIKVFGNTVQRNFYDEFSAIYNSNQAGHGKEYCTEKKHFGEKM
jgi:hypothetical protein